MPASNDNSFHTFLGSISITADKEDAVAQNKRVREAGFAKDSREPTAEESAIKKAEVLKIREQELDKLVGVRLPPQAQQRASRCENARTSPHEYFGKLPT